MANIFAKAAKAAPLPKVEKAKKEKTEITIVDLENLAQIDALMKALSGAKAAIEMSVKSQSFDQFIKTTGDGKLPVSFRGIEGSASASMEMRKRSTASALTADEVALLALNNVAVHTQVSVQELFVVNPAYASDSKMLEKVSKAIEKIAGVPEDFIQMQAEKSTQVVSEETFAAAFAGKVNPDVVRIVSTLAVKPKLDETDISKIIDGVKSLLVTEDEKDAKKK